MMAIERISKIKNHRIFRDFEWPGALLDFKEKNLIYGWNGTGKSTLSNLFRSLESRIPITEGEVEFVISGAKLNGSEFEKAQFLPEVRVFNADFISQNVFTDQGDASPIFFLGQRSIELQQRLDELQSEHRESEANLRTRTQRRDRARKDLDDFKIAHARTVKNMLSSPGGGNPYNTYNKRKYQDKCDQYIELPDVDRRALILNTSDLDKKKRAAGSDRMNELPPIEFRYPDTQELTDSVAILLGKQVTSKVIDTLKSDHALAKWVETGLDMHKEKQSNSCLFCRQPLPGGRVRALEAHFSKEFNTLAAEIKDQSSAVESAIESLNLWAPSHASNLYQDLRSDFDSRCQDVSREIGRIKEYLESLLSALRSKARNPFQALDLTHEVVTGNADAISSVNAIICGHNERSGKFQAAIESARSAIETSLIAQDLVEYRRKRNEVRDAEKDFLEAASKSMILTDSIVKIQSEIAEHRRPAEEMNADIRSYLGRNELTFEIRDNGYQISRHGTFAEDLSEGEKTAIAFLYFLKSLEDRSFALRDGVVVIDDPVSSLDSNALFHAFGFLREKTKQAGQLFVLTHNYSFFRQVRNWFNSIDRQHDGDSDQKLSRFYMLLNKTSGQSRSSSISELDTLLHKYESEYHYLFSLVYRAANSDEKMDLEQYYILPNVARRLLESFLAFRYPTKSGGLSQQLSDIENFDVAKRTTILRFVHSYSHADQIADPEHDLSVLIESKQILADLLSLIEREDERHYRQMEKLVTR